MLSMDTSASMQLVADVRPEPAIRSMLALRINQHKQKKPRDPTIAVKFNTYRFADYKGSMIASPAKLVRVSVDMVAIAAAMKAVERP